MNANRKLKIDFRINGAHDHWIEQKHGKHVDKAKATKKRRR